MKKKYNGKMIAEIKTIGDLKTYIKKLDNKTIISSGIRRSEEGGTYITETNAVIKVSDIDGFPKKELLLFANQEKP